MFAPVETNASFPQLEEAVLEFWRKHKIYEQSLEQRAGAESFVFFEGPPTANGMPHPGHCLTRAIKDLFPRYQTMRGRLCTRKAGWDTHGLPVEVEVCKELGIHSKEEIESYGVEPFIQLCQRSVWRYMQEWERLTERLGFWIKLDEAYVTYHQSYVESVWWSLKQLFERGLLYLRGARPSAAVKSGKVTSRSLTPAFLCGFRWLIAPIHPSWFGPQLPGLSPAINLRPFTRRSNTRRSEMSSRAND